jgi:hypothetical protein
MEPTTMNRDEFTWIIIRALGVVTLWLFLIHLVGQLVYVPALISEIHQSSAGSEHNLNMTGELYRALSTGAVELLTYGLLSFYLIRKGKSIHGLILRNIPSA